MTEIPPRPSWLELFDADQARKVELRPVCLGPIWHYTRALEARIQELEQPIEENQP